MKEVVSRRVMEELEASGYEPRLHPPSVEGGQSARRRDVIRGGDRIVVTSDEARARRLRRLFEEPRPQSDRRPAIPERRAGQDDAGSNVMPAA